MKEKCISSGNNTIKILIRDEGKKMKITVL